MWEIIQLKLELTNCVCIIIVSLLLINNASTLKVLAIRNSQ